MKPVILIFIVFLIDQLTKYYFYGKNFDFISNVFGVTSTTNTGALFGIFKGYNLILIFVSIAIIFLCFKWLKEKSFNYVPLSFIIGGAFGNLVDRLIFGYVRDFLDFKIWPVFNFADTIITIAIVLIIWKEVKK